MQVKGSKMVARALEDEGVSLVFGLPGTQDVELYDALEHSKVRAVTAVDELGAAFMADGLARSSRAAGVVALVPGPGLTQALSGLAEAHSDGVPIVALCCGVRSDVDKGYQIGEADQLAMLGPVTKETVLIRRPEEIYQAVRRAVRAALSGRPGPVAVVIPANFYMLPCCSDEPAFREPAFDVPEPSEAELEEAAHLIDQSKRPALYIGAGCRGAEEQVLKLAEKLGAPVATTLQAKGIFPEDHPLWLWNGFGRSAPSFVRRVMDGRDLLLAVGCRFSEAATGNYDLPLPQTFIHVDVDKSVLGRNYPAKLTVVSDAGTFMERLLRRLPERGKDEELQEEIASGHWDLRGERRSEKSERVTPAAFFEALQKAAGKDAVYASDSGNGTFLAVEHLLLKGPGRFLAPVDFSCMGYAVPAAVGAKLAQPDRDVIALEGDGALLMTGLELLTAAQHKAPVLVALLRDGELGQVADAQRRLLNRRVSGTLPSYKAEDFAKLTGCEYRSLEHDADAEKALEEAVRAARGERPVLLEVAIDYSMGTFFSRGTAAAHMWRLPLGERIRRSVRLMARRIAAGRKKSG